MKHSFIWCGCSIVLFLSSARAEKINSLHAEFYTKPQYSDSGYFFDKSLYGADNVNWSNWVSNMDLEAYSGAYVGGQAYQGHGVLKTQAFAWGQFSSNNVSSDVRVSVSAQSQFIDTLFTDAGPKNGSPGFLNFSFYVPGYTAKGTSSDGSPSLGFASSYFGVFTARDASSEGITNSYYESTKFEYFQPFPDDRYITFSRPVVLGESLYFDVFLASDVWADSKDLVGKATISLLSDYSHSAYFGGFTLSDVNGNVLKNATIRGEELNDYKRSYVPGEGPKSVPDSGVGVLGLCFCFAALEFVRRIVRGSKPELAPVLFH